MARPTFAELLTDLRIPENIQQILLDEQYDTESFGLVALSLNDLDSVLDSMSVDISYRVRSSLRVLWTRCQLLHASGSSQSSGLLSGDSIEPLSGARPGSSWNEPFPSKLSPDLIRELRDNFERQYPGELLDPDLMPSSRMLALTYQQLQRKEWKWIAWKYRLSAKLQDESSMIRARKAARSELTALSDLLLDDIPVRDIPSSNIGLQQLSQLLHLQATAVAFCRGAHLSTLKKYVHRFLSLASQRFEPDSGLRPPNVAELQSADQILWGKIAELYNYKQWTLDDAIHELVEIRADMASLLQPRPFVPRMLPKGKGKGSPKGSGKSLAKGSPKGASSTNRPAWGTEVTRDGQNKTICLKYQQKTCPNPKACKYEHVCAVLKSDGTVCGQKHSAADHRAAPF